MDPSQEAFQAFMLAGKGKTEDISSPGSVSTPSWQKKETTPQGKGARSMAPVLKAVKARFAEWKDIDDQLCDVLDSISNLRDRIWWETLELKRSEEMAKSKPWEMFKIHDRRTFLTIEDIELARGHDLLQHEKMLSVLRSLMASLAKAQDATSRRLDELLRIQLAQGFDQESVMDATNLFHFCAEELQRKQDLVWQILSSAHDGLIDEDATLHQGDDLNPRQTIRKCRSLWTTKDKDMLSKLDEYSQ